MGYPAAKLAHTQIIVDPSNSKIPPPFENPYQLIKFHLFLVALLNSKRLPRLRAHTDYPMTPAPFPRSGLGVSHAGLISKSLLWGKRETS
ncbi:hypothetical protein CEXT_114391 [Caerostris extrusa]|uniref:Uncharacterized protein n=1 Tax=Caerostris extrusa TaxID=172846 RepID=A0AAV4W0I2_CAEEX|nr:hypothetical protein CEXT_114391 [Caerostris extrusa]